MTGDNDAPDVRSWLAVIALLAFAGCGPSATDGPKRFDLSGKVVYDGKPVPLGSIRFSPDTAKGNEGPGTMVRIRNGTYETASGKGVVGGPMLVEIHGFDGIPAEVEGEMDQEGSDLFIGYKTEVDLPRKNGQHDFDVPKQNK